MSRPLLTETELRAVLTSWKIKTRLQGGPPGPAMIDKILDTLTAHYRQHDALVEALRSLVDDYYRGCSLQNHAAQGVG